jgi:DNA topoisomerase-1
MTRSTLGRTRARRSDPLASDPLQSAIEAGLRYVDAGSPGIRRVRSGKGFRYVTPDGRIVRDPEELKRIKALVIPPAWTNVWICPTRFGHIQAMGWDARGRRQYRYHAAYRHVRDQAKFGKMIAFGTVLAVIRKRVRKDLRRVGLPREKVLAAVVRLLETTCVRVGNTEYAKQNESFGLTTLRNHHARVSGEAVRFEFKGKSGQRHRVELADPKLARIVRECQELPGHQLFEYVDEAGSPCTVSSGDVNDYLREITGQQFTAKDFRTWAGTVAAARELAAEGPARNKAGEKRMIAAAVTRVSEQLGNRPSACRKYYIHPAILDAYSDGSLFQAMQQGAAQHAAYNGRGLLPEEYSAMVLIAKALEEQNNAKEHRAAASPRAA